MKKLLVVIDMQNDFIDGSLGTKEAVSIVTPVADRITHYTEQQDDIVFTKDTHSENYLNTNEGKNLPVEHCIKDTFGWELRKELAALATDCKTFEKPTFGSKELASYVAEKGYKDIELIGLCTDICVISNALLIKAFLPESNVSVNASCCAGVTPESHSNAIEAMKMCQIQII